MGKSNKTLEEHNCFKRKTTVYQIRNPIRSRYFTIDNPVILNQPDKYSKEDISNMKPEYEIKKNQTEKLDMKPKTDKELNRWGKWQNGYI